MKNARHERVFLGLFKTRAGKFRDVDTATQFSNPTLISIYLRLFIICFYLPACASVFLALWSVPSFLLDLS